MVLMPAGLSIKSAVKIDKVLYNPRFLYFPPYKRISWH
ncbi:unknown [[Mannheimia] succiniciproducens MBEL55E]|uniref:Uncharacterized protein n=1 Tax=Mannheimia succiniciproducens (strain KCTC 0769BP / MBEL55E) TaxID=221988 RepID=Q65W21_MANSM|nr:unknown [[Mannheimia] succiniciproducens MBEL55E]